MKRYFVIALAMIFSGCANMTPTQLKATKITIGILAVGAVYAYQESHGHHHSDAPAHKSDCLMKPGYCAGRDVGK